MVRHPLVQRIVKAYERYDEAIGRNRQLTCDGPEPERSDGRGDDAPSANEVSAEVQTSKRHRQSMSPGDSTLVFRRAPRGIDRKGLRLVAERLERQLAGGRKFHCLLTGDRELRRLNRVFLGKDYPTDVLSFPEVDTAGPSLGEIAISVTQAADQAREYGHSVEDEIAILMLHGVLHLLGMDHERDRGRMRRTEGEWRAKLGLPHGLIERARP